MEIGFWIGTVTLGLALWMGTDPGDDKTETARRYIGRLLISLVAGAVLMLLLTGLVPHLFGAPTPGVGEPHM